MLASAVFVLALPLTELTHSPQIRPSLVGGFMLVFAIGFVLGGVATVWGIKSKLQAGALIANGVGWVVGLVGQFFPKDTPAAALVATIWSTPWMVNGLWRLTSGALCGWASLIAIQFVLATALAYQKYKDRGVDHALSAACRRAGHLVQMGAVDYLKKPPAEPRDPLRRLTTRVDLLTLNQMALQRMLADGVVSTKEARTAFETQGALLLNQIFDDTSLEHFRLAVFQRVPGGAFEPIARVEHPRKKGKARRPLSAGSFLAATVADGETRVFPRDRDQVPGVPRPFEVREGVSFKSFCVVPIGSSGWGAVSIDTTRKDTAFTKDRVAAVEDFARFVDVVCLLGTSLTNVHRHLELRSATVVDLAGRGANDGSPSAGEAENASAGATREVKAS